MKPLECPAPDTCIYYDYEPEFNHHPFACGSDEPERLQKWLPWDVCEECPFEHPAVIELELRDYDEAMATVRECFKLYGDNPTEEQIKLYCEGG